MTIASIPTKYAGCAFRSRLEARWAAFFDIVGWSWDYEPVDLHGWCPDFSLRGHSGLIYVEVKPAEWKARRLDISLFGKVFRNAPKTGDLLLLGLGPVFDSDSDKFYIGSCNQPGEWDSSSEGNFDTAVAQIAYGNIPFGYCHETGCFSDRITGFHDKGGGWMIGVDEGPLYWREAGNRVQWRPA